jgi:putative ABC transport system permease protein
MCRAAGVPAGSNILLNSFGGMTDDRRTEFVPYVFVAGQTLDVSGSGKYAEGLKLHGELRYTDIPSEVRLVCSGDLLVLVPDLEVARYIWFSNAADKTGFIEYANMILMSMIPVYGEPYVYIDVQDVEAVANAQRGTNTLMSVFMYGFVAVLALIALTNVISSISTNVRSRAREFAILRSVGMTDGGLSRMINLESVLSSIRSLAIGLPLGLAASFLLHRVMMNSYDFEYDFPWLAAAVCVLGVFALNWVTMRFAAYRLRGSNIIDTIRSNT